MKRISIGRSFSDCSPYETRVYRTHADRKRALKQLRRYYNYFILYLDTKGLALSCGFAAWVGPRGEYVDY